MSVLFLIFLIFLKPSSHKYICIHACSYVCLTAVLVMSMGCLKPCTRLNTSTKQMGLASNGGGPSLFHFRPCFIFLNCQSAVCSLFQVLCQTVRAPACPCYFYCTQVLFRNGEFYFAPFFHYDWMNI